jgi:hypothetical protein
MVSTEALQAEKFFSVKDHVCVVTGGRSGSYFPSEEQVCYWRFQGDRLDWPQAMFEMYGQKGEVLENRELERSDV